MIFPTTDREIRHYSTDLRFPKSYPFYCQHHLQPFSTSIKNPKKPYTPSLKSFSASRNILSVLFTCSNFMKMSSYLKQTKYLLKNHYDVKENKLLELISHCWFLVDNLFTVVFLLSQYSCFNYLAKKKTVLSLQISIKTSKSIVPTFFRPIEKTKVLKDSFNQFE